MTPERWQQVEEIFQTTLDLPVEKRARHVAESCVGDGELRCEVEAMLKQYEMAEGVGDFLDEPFCGEQGLSALAALASGEGDPMAGRRVGAYKIEREIGRGGMGAVYLAARDDDQYRKQVAIKLIRRGLDTEDILRRFRTERQILANLDHPNIARLLEGGTTEDNLPYLVMEYIEGQPINVYADAHKLSTIERLKLFRTVCVAVTYAHQRLVIHRDIKPGNILVTADGTPKLLDFGIAKLLDTESSQTDGHTVTALGVMTPEYASPEQVRGESVTTASDVYSLGVVLYELLTGHRPYRLKSRRADEIARVICEEEPVRPSQSLSNRGLQIADSKDSPFNSRSAIRDSKALRGDLDNIVLMAMRKEPERRYASVEQFSEDIRRHLNALPVIARKDTLHYRSAKFIKRNRVSVAAAGVVALAVIAGFVATVWQWRVAQAERARVELLFNDVRQLANSFMFELHDAIENLPGSTPARELVIRRALEYLDRLAQKATDNASLQAEVAAAYQRVGDVQGNPNNANLGDTAGALQSYRKALAISEALAARDPTNAARYGIAVSYDKIGDMLAAMGHPAGAVESRRQAQAILAALVTAGSADGRARISLARSYIKLGDDLGNPNFLNLSDPPGAIESYRKALAISEALSAADPQNTQARRYLALSHERIGDMQQVSGDAVAALESYHKSQTIFTALSIADPVNVRTRRALAVSYEKIGNIMVANGDAAKALENYREELTIVEPLSQADPANKEMRRVLAMVYQNIGRALAAMGETREALRNRRKAITILEELVAADPTNAQNRHNLVDAYSNLGQDSVPARSRGSDSSKLKVIAASKP